MTERVKWVCRYVPADSETNVDVDRLRSSQNDIERERSIKLAKNCEGDASRMLSIWTKIAYP